MVLSQNVFGTMCREMEKTMARSYGAYTRAAAGVAGGLMLLGVGGAAIAAHPDAEDSKGVELNLEIEDAGDLGALTLTVDGTETTLAEGTATADNRYFEGTLPDTTVTDTRTEVDSGVYWYVTGQASDFVGDAGQAPIGPEKLGWTPALLTESDGEVMAGDEVVSDELDPTSGDNNVGLEGEELLQLSLDSVSAQAGNGEWTANAELSLVTPLDVEAGAYVSTLTLSLFEDGI